MTSAAFLTVPKDLVAVLGARVELECSTDRLNLSLHWSYYASNNRQRLVSLFNGDSISKAFASTYEVEAIPSSGHYNLIIKSANFSRAGEYLCSEDLLNRGAAVAFLTVISRFFICNENVCMQIYEGNKTLVDAISGFGLRNFEPTKTSAGSNSTRSRRLQILYTPLKIGTNSPVWRRSHSNSPPSPFDLQVVGHREGQ